ncbi:type II secretion system protein GspM [Roseomonas populi]|uniref:Type II secretion system protein GspM n=1 Tax=Roseomonas populi TaxID=3121582 RepID=A0ABT1X9J7_9PROT|nr:type II secretion system protein GspM [Roseomonas pecuniae]MCR0983644.1 type II secretion system protein GspM [Roseomonas pecuniae]
MMNLSKPVRRLVALALLALIPAVAWLFVVVPWLDARAELSARAENAMAVAARSMSVAAREPALLAEAAALRQALSGVTDLSGGSYALAGAELQRRLREAAGRHRGTINSIETLPEGRGDGGKGRVGVRARLQTDPEGLQNLLAELETGKALLQVQTLTLTTAGNGPNRPLDVQIELFGTRREETPR